MTTAEPRTRRTPPGRPRGWRRGTNFSKMVVRRVGDMRALRSSVDVHRSRVAAGLGERLAAELAEGETLPDFDLTLDLVVRSAESALERLRAAERRYLGLQSECRRIRHASEKLARREVYPRVVSVRRLIEAQFGREHGRQVHGMAGRTLRKAKRLHGQLQYLVWTLEDVRSPLLPAPVLAGLAANRETWLGEIEPGYRRLTDLLDELLDLELSEQEARDDRNVAMKTFDVAYGEALRLVHANFTFAGYGETLARRLRSYFQRRLHIRRAREKREARAEGRVKQTLRSAASSVLGLLGKRPPSVA
ncbi:MAG: hypothetical protein GY719_18120 [bacterium]|nr:hypothetical protein [bacterium]